MSLVSNSAFTNNSLHPAQHGLAPVTVGPEGGLCISQDSLLNGQSSSDRADIAPFVNNNYHISASSETSESDLHETGQAEEDNSPVIDIIINNVVCTFNTRCYLNLKKIAMEGVHVEYRRENGMLNMKIRRPQATATIWSSGKITCTGSTSEDDAKLAARRIARRLQKLGFSVRFCSYRVVNVLGTCSLPFGIKLNQFSEDNRENASYEPELHPGVTYRIKHPKATLKVFSTGSITVTAPCVLNIQTAIEHIYPIVSQYKMEAPAEHKIVVAESRYLKTRTEYIGYPVLRYRRDDDDDDMDDLDEEDDDLDDDDVSDSFDSDVSQD